MYYFFVKLRQHKKKQYWFNGSAFVSESKIKKSFSSATQGRKVINKFLKKEGQLPLGATLHIVKIAKEKAAKKKTYPLLKIKRAKKNPTTTKKIDKAIRLFEKFSGHIPEYIDKKDLPKIDVGFKIGTLDGLLYTTVRDGRTEKYVHKFKRRARPILVSNFDGSFIALVGGHYKFTDRGIVDI